MSNFGDDDDVRFGNIMDEAEELEIERELEERIRKAQEEGNDKLFDESDCQSVRSMQTTMTNMNFIPEDADLDDVLEQILKTKNQVHVAELEREQQRVLNEFREEQNNEMDMIITEERKQDMEDLKKLNELDLNTYMPQAVEEDQKKQVDGDQEENDGSMDLTTASNVKVDYMEQIKKAREQAAVVEFRFAEDEILQKIEEEKKVKVD